MPQHSPDSLADTIAPRILRGERRALARAITLIESGRADHRAQAVALLDRLKDAGRSALRVGLSGTPGVGKSTFIESFGMMLTAQGKRVAVLAVDPSSARSGGSILGDKTRMERLSRDPNAFIRPSPSQTQLGGVARRTREAVMLCEAAGFDLVLIETVGVGQSETVVAEMSDLFLLLMAPAGGDELQGVKRGIMEIADMIVVNKADGALKSTATRTCADYAGALRLLRKRPQDPDEFPKAIMVSAVEEMGLQAAWDDMQLLAEWRRASGHWATRRAAQAQYWFEEEVRQGLLARLTTDPVARARLAELGAQVAKGKALPGVAADEMLNWLAR
ncbi:methylmalonyl Co-A mutase-associated GTPase MeaB [Meridianimarinicoccus aquatilis]|uniref:Methylmalonyl Co-A mutase-associated GTPase MeaB n=1 Tax=Meridianimarinicoccus aquatilis TaxID=2552766 RepID=A0A4R6AD27_9RHOB|nr:methylmalonyl Co-A mutase-associated GTPase MeaB [Fluviibacterium aquatile]QIE40523.1 methylmalonyl Co-A mutase-associated GTPase MeaB [Rhodobacteraceae bacterium SC52]TDL81740.1 methylmalonyl Co-A mutase-associated GTPase MeaB [Fluviibacterium aquatile]